VTPPFVDAAVERLRLGVIAAVSNDIEAARAALQVDDSERLLAWCREGARPSTVRTGITDLRRRYLSSMRRSQRVDAMELRVILERDQHRCRICDIPLVHRNDLRRLGELVGDDVLYGRADDTRPRAAIATSPLWLLTCAMADTTPPDGHQRESDPIACCRRCHDLVSSSRLDPLELEHARDREPTPAPDWAHLLGFLHLSPEMPRAVVRHALLLEGSTLNIAGEIHPMGVSKDELSISIIGAARTVRARVEMSDADGRSCFHGFADIDEAIRSVETPGLLRTELRTGDATIPSILLPGATDSPNRLVVEAAPACGNSGRTAHFEALDGIALRISEIEAQADVVEIGVADSTLTIEISPISASTSDVTTVDSVWMQRRGDRSIAERLTLSARDHRRWSLTVEDRLIPRQSQAVDLWDIWVAWRSNGEVRTTRAGRVSSDLLDLRDAVRLPSMRVHAGDVQLDVRPYFTISKHLAVRVSTSTAEPS
jgi:hypothetical protein